MKQKIFDSELKLMEIVWEREPISAKELSIVAAAELGWNKNTTYTVATKLCAKGFLTRSDPGFICSSAVSKDELRRSETQGLADRLFGGSKKALFSALLEDETFTQSELDELRRMIDRR